MLHEHILFLPETIDTVVRLRLGRKIPREIHAMMIMIMIRKVSIERKGDRHALDDAIGRREVRPDAAALGADWDKDQDHPGPPVWTLDIMMSAARTLVSAVRPGPVTLSRASATWCLCNIHHESSLGKHIYCGQPDAAFTPYSVIRFMPTSLPYFPIKLESLSASPLPGAASDDDSCGKKPDEEDPPPLGFKLTGYRLLNVAVIVGFGILKAVRVHCGQPWTPTTLEIVGGTVWTLMYALFDFHGNHDTGPS